MAIDTGLYSPQQFKLGYVKEGTLGTAAVTSGGSETFQLLNITGVPTVTRNAVRFMDVRHGDGRVAKKADAYVNQYGEEKVLSFSCYYDTTSMPHFLENVIGLVVGTSPASFDIAYNYTPPECKVGDTDTDYTGALTFVIVHPESGKSEIIPGCIIRSLTFSANVGDDGGRFKVDVEAATRCNLVMNATESSWTQTAYSTTYRSIYDLTTKKINSQDMVLNGLSVTINNNLKFYGFGANGIPDQLGRGMPEIACTGSFGIKYDVNTAPFFNSSLNETDMPVEISNHATWASATFGLKGSYGQISDSFDLGEVDSGAFIDLPLKFLASTSGDVIQIVP